MLQEHFPEDRQVIQSGKFNVEIPGFLKMIVSNNIARYEFIDAKKNETLWTNVKVGNGLRP